jgi:tRNA nucleotidyltransferase (CCA-adding enzyme)
VISVETAARLIKKGCVVAYPTETAYGLGASALNKKAVERVYQLKKREKTKKLPVIVSTVADLEGHAFVNELGHYLSRHLHPGPLNIVVKSDYAWIGAFRMSSSSVASKLAKLAGPVTATSANLGGGKTPFTPEDIKKHFDVPVVGEAKLKEVPVSTIYDPFTLRILRKGAVSETEIKRHVVAFNALKMVKPLRAGAEKIEKIAGEVLRIVRKKHRKTILGGSIAKGTFTKSVNDIDLFLLFPKKEKLEDKLEFLKKVAGSFSKRVETSYAQHPYVKASYKGTTVEVVPAYETEPPEVLSAADRSRWHVKFVLKFPEWLKDEVRIFKQFCLGVGVYGADVKVEGLSAYAMEVLVAKNGGFVKTIEKLAGMEWPLHLSDPVDEERNVLASVGRDSFELLKEAAQKYLKSPGETFFFPGQAPELKKLPKLRNKALVVLKRPNLPEDAVWGNAKKRARKIERNAKLDGYVVKRWDVFVGEHVLLLFEVFPGETKLLVKGPPLSKKKHAEKFKEAHPGWFEEGERVFAREKRRFASFSEFVKHFEEAETFEGKEIETVYRGMKPKEKTWVVRFFLNKKPWEY